MKNQESFETYPELNEVLKRIDDSIAAAATPPEQVTWNNDQLCDELKISRRTAASWRAKGKIPYSKIDGLIFYNKKDVLTFLEEHKVKPIKKRSRLS